MEMDFNFWLQFAIVMVCVAIGGRLGGVGLSAAGGLGVCLLVLVLGVPRVLLRFPSCSSSRRSSPVRPSFRVRAVLT